MGKNNLISGILVLVVILLIASTTIMVVSYTTGIVNAAVAFASTEQAAKLQACGVTMPNELIQLKADIPGLLLPAIYVGLPALFIVLSILMFIAGYFYGSGMESRSSSESTTTTSDQNRSKSSGRYKPGQHVEKTTTQKSSRSGSN